MYHERRTDIQRYNSSPAETNTASTEKLSTRTWHETQSERTLFFHPEDTLSRTFRNVRCQGKQRQIPTGCIHCYEYPNTNVLCASFHSCCTNSLAVCVLNQQHTPQFILDMMVLRSFYEAVVHRQNITQLLLCGIKLWAVPNFMNCFETSRWMHTSLAANTINNIPSAQFKWRQLPTAPPLDASCHGRHGAFVVYFTTGSLSGVDGRKFGWKRPWRKRATILGFVWR